MNNIQYFKIFNRLLIIDGSHMLHRNLSQPNNWEMQTSSGIKTGGIFGVLRSLMKEVNLFNYYPVLVFDGGLSKRRLQIYPNYKHYLERQEKKSLYETINEMSEEDKLQEEMRMEYKVQRDMLKQLLPFFNIPVISFKDWEGDDLIYLLTRISKDSIVVSDDKDLLQLIYEDVNGRCRIRRAMRDEFWDLSKLKESSEDVNDYITTKCIIGDTSDNIPSACYGVGEKTANSLYKFYSYIVEHKLQYPRTEEDLTKLCKEHNLSKRKAFINFDENQFCTNLQLTDLKLVDKDVIEIEPKMLDNIIKDINVFALNKFDENLQKENILKMLQYLEIKTFDYNYFYNMIKLLKDVIYSDTSLAETNFKI